MKKDWGNLEENITENADIYGGKLFKAVIPCSSILLYLAHEEDEEIIAHGTDNYEVIE